MESRILKTRDLSGGQKQYTTMINKKEGMISIAELQGLVHKIKTKGVAMHGDFTMPLIKVLNGDKWVTFSNEEAFDNYYEGAVKDPEKFSHFLQLQITTIF
jgi:hypothetical protein